MSGVELVYSSLRNWIGDGRRDGYVEEWKLKGLGDEINLFPVFSYVTFEDLNTLRDVEGEIMLALKSPAGSRCVIQTSSNSKASASLFANRGMDYDLVSVQRVACD